MKTDILMSGSTVKKHISFKTVFEHNVRGELRSDRGSMLIEFFLKLAFFNIHDTFKTGK